MSTENQNSNPAPLENSPAPIHGAAPPAFSPLPAATNPAEAQQQLALRKNDASFRAALIGGNAAAKAEWDAINHMAVTGDSAAPASAAETQKALALDPEFRRRLLSGDAAAQLQWAKANEASAAAMTAVSEDTPSDIDVAFPVVERVEQIDWSPAFAQNATHEEIHQWGAVAIDARLDKSSASEFVQIGMEAQTRTAAMNPQQRQDWQSSEWTTLVKNLGGGSEEKAAERIKASAAVLAELEKKHQGVTQKLADSGALDDSRFVTRLVRHHERLSARRAELDGRRK